MHDYDTFIEPVGDFQLKDCPFCGCEDVLYAKYEGEVGTRYAVFCPGCAASIDPGWATQKSIVRDMWNKRAE